MAAAGGGFIGKIGGKIDDLVRISTLKNSLKIADKISSGHAFDDHIGEFSYLGITTKEQFKNHVDSAIKRSISDGKIKSLSSSKVGMYDISTNTIIIYNPNVSDF